MHHPLLHIANVLYLASYSVRDILLLRILTVAAMLSLSWCYYCDQLYNALIWQTAFLLINFVQIGILLYERRPVKLTETQQELHAGPLKNLTPRQVQKFTDRASWSTVRTGEVLLEENTHLENLVLILSGGARVRANGKEIAQLGAGQFVGEMSFLTGGLTTAEVIATSPLLIAQWPEKYVTELIKKDQDLGTALQAALGSDLVSKLLKSRQS